MENTRGQQIAADALVTAAVLALGAVLVGAGRALAGAAAPGASGGWLRIAAQGLEQMFDGGDSPRVDVLLGLVASLVGLVVVAWWLLSAAFAMAAALMCAAGAHGAAHIAGGFAPAFMRRLALAMLGLSLIAAPAAHAQSLPDPAWHPLSAAAAASAPTAAATAPAPPAGSAARISDSSPEASASAASPPTVTPGAATTSALPPASERPVPGGPGRAESAVLPEAGWVPSSVPADPGPIVQQPTRDTAPAAREPVEVRPGDTLWAIVARQLGAGATELEVAAAWPAWYRANAGVIGDSPHLIQPGQLLIPPH